MLITLKVHQVQKVYLTLMIMTSNNFNTNMKNQMKRKKNQVKNHTIQKKMRMKKKTTRMNLSAETLRDTMKKIKMHRDQTLYENDRYKYIPDSKHS